MHLHGSGILFYVNSVLKDHISAGVIISSKLIVENSIISIFVQQCTVDHLHSVSPCLPLTSFSDTLQFASKSIKHRFSILFSPQLGISSFLIFNLKKNTSGVLIGNNRYIIFRNNKLHYFEGINVYLWLIPPFFFFTIWGSSIYINFGPNQMKKDYFRNVTLELYDEDIDKIAFIAPLYFVSCYFSFHIIMLQIFRLEGKMGVVSSIFLICLEHF